MLSILPQKIKIQVSLNEKQNDANKHPAHNLETMYFIFILAKHFHTTIFTSQTTTLFLVSLDSLAPPFFCVLGILNLNFSN